jgi:hypothetical protein
VRIFDGVIVEVDSRGDLDLVGARLTQATVDRLLSTMMRGLIDNVAFTNLIRGRAFLKIGFEDGKLIGKQIYPAEAE